MCVASTVMLMLMYVYMQIMEIKLLLLENKRGRKTVYGLILTLFRLGFFGFPGPGGGGGGLQKPGPSINPKALTRLS